VIDLCNDDVAPEPTVPTPVVERMLAPRRRDDVRNNMASVTPATQTTEKPGGLGKTRATTLAERRRVQFAGSVESCSVGGTRRDHGKTVFGCKKRPEPVDGLQEEEDDAGSDEVHGDARVEEESMSVASRSKMRIRDKMEEPFGSKEGKKAKVKGRGKKEKASEKESDEGSDIPLEDANPVPNGAKGNRRRKWDMAETASGADEDSTDDDMPVVTIAKLRSASNTRKALAGFNRSDVEDNELPSGPKRQVKRVKHVTAATQ
jgi:hypothetical protein